MDWKWIESVLACGCAVDEHNNQCCDKCQLLGLIRRLDADRRKHVAELRKELAAREHQVEMVQANCREHCDHADKQVALQVAAAYRDAATFMRYHWAEWWTSGELPTVAKGLAENCYPHIAKRTPADALKFYEDELRRHVDSLLDRFGRDLMELPTYELGGYHHVRRTEVMGVLSRGRSEK